MKESRVCVQIDGIHGNAYASEALLPSAGVFQIMCPEGTAGGRVDDRVLILNPVSGSQSHVDTVVELGTEHGFDVRKTEKRGDAKRLARDAAPDADLIAAGGGDGTVNKVVNGIAAANELETTTVAVIPAGTGNNFATNIGIRGLEHAFSVIETGRRRWIDLGTANDRIFVNSCVGGITAEASSKTGPESKANLGVLAYVKSMLATMGSFDALPLRVETAPVPNGNRTQAWDGRAMFVLIGNCRRFTGARTAQANVEDGLLEVTIVEDAAAMNLLGDAALQRLLGRDSNYVVRRRAPSLMIESSRDAIEYSLDGEMLETHALRLETVPRTLQVAVGDGYQPDPDDGLF